MRKVTSNLKLPGDLSAHVLDNRIGWMPVIFSEFSIVVFRFLRVLLVMGALGLSGCSTVGTRAITGGRATYAEVINRTGDEQILNVIVRMRYDETFGMISVAGVTANLSFSGQAGANIGIGNSDGYAGNLVPLSFGVSYEENPTISYVPLSGDDFMTKMLSPVSMNEWMLLAATAKHPGHVFDLAARRVNGLQNPFHGEEPSSPEFARFIELYDQLRRAGVLDIVQTPGNETEKKYFWDFHNFEEGHGDSVRELLDLLGIKVETDKSPILLPFRYEVGKSDSAIHFQSRSAYEILRLFGTGIQTPSPHIEAGVVEPLAFAVPEESQFITIQSSEKRPDNATVRVRFRDRWFYIDATDTQSKRAFLFLQTFISMRLANPKAAQNLPVITVPVK